MTPTSARLDDLRQRLASLRTRFAEVGARAAATAPEVAASVVPDESLLDDLKVTAVEFDGLRHAIVDELSAFPKTPDPAKLGTLKALDAVLTAMERVEAEHARREAWEAARDEAIDVLGRVMALVHREDTESSVLADCQAQARELHEALASAPSGDVVQLGAHLRPFVELVTLAEGWDRLDDERCASLQDAITQNFGRPLGLAALRGKLGQAGEIAAEPEPMPVAPEVEEAAAPPPEPQAADVPAAAVPAAAVPATPAPAPSEPAAAPSVRASGTPPVIAGDAIAPPGSPLVVEIRMSGERVQVETPQERREREELLERLAADSARWWIGARTGWEALVQRGLSPAEAARDTLKRFPYLLSVPLSRSDEFESGRLAEGYAILLQRIEKEEPGFVKGALTRLNPQFTGRANDQTYALGQELYVYVVAEGRLYKTFPDFLKDVLVHALPEPGLWLQGTITEADDSTTLVTHPEEPGGRREEPRRLTALADRVASHTFSVTTGPLTTRVFSVQAGELCEPIDLEIHLKENGAATDHAWIVVAPMSGKPEPPRKHRVGGTKIEQLGKQLRAVWIAAFNSDPNADKTYELAVALKRRAAAPPPKAEPQAAPSSFGKSSPFKKR
jgi:hypothetical protein